jgi:hypothetical protein
VVIPTVVPAVIVGEGWRSAREKDDGEHRHDSDQATHEHGHPQADHSFGAA